MAKMPTLFQGRVKGTRACWSVRYAADADEWRWRVCTADQERAGYDYSMQGARTRAQEVGREMGGAK